MSKPLPESLWGVRCLENNTLILQPKKNTSMEDTPHPTLQLHFRERFLVSVVAVGFLFFLSIHQFKSEKCFPGEKVFEVCFRSAEN